MLNLEEFMKIRCPAVFNHIKNFGIFTKSLFVSDHEKKCGNGTVTELTVNPIKGHRPCPGRLMCKLDRIRLY